MFSDGKRRLNFVKTYEIICGKHSYIQFTQVYNLFFLCTHVYYTVPSPKIHFDQTKWVDQLSGYNGWHCYINIRQIVVPLTLSSLIILSYSILQIIVSNICSLFIPLHICCFCFLFVLYRMFDCDLRLILALLAQSQPKY